MRRSLFYNGQRSVTIANREWMGHQIRIIELDDRFRPGNDEIFILIAIRRYGFSAGSFFDAPMLASCWYALTGADYCV